MMKPKLSVKKYSLVLAGEFAALGAGAVILLVFVASTLDASLIQNGQQAAVVTSVLADLANADRSLHGVGELTVSPALTRIAQDKADDMAAKGYFAHNSPDGLTPWHWFKKEGYAFSNAGENLAVDFSDSAAVQAAWMASPTHRANMLNAHFTEVGIATAVGTYQGHRTVFIVEEFATPLTNATEAPTAADPPATEPFTHSERVLGAEAEAARERIAQPAAAPVQQEPSAPVSEAATATPDGGAQPPARLTPAETLAASPRATLHTAYLLFTALIFLALLAATGREVKKRHARHVALALGLLALMGSLLYVADRTVFPAPVITQATETGRGG